MKTNNGATHEMLRGWLGIETEGTKWGRLTGMAEKWESRETERQENG